MGTLICAVFSSPLVLFLFPIRFSATIWVTCLQKCTAKKKKNQQQYFLLLFCFVSWFYFFKSTSYPAITVTNVVRKNKRGDYKYGNSSSLSPLFILLTNLIHFYGTENMSVSKAYTFHKQTKGKDDWGYSTSGRKQLLKLIFLFPGLMLRYGEMNCLAVYLIPAVLF